MEVLEKYREAMHRDAVAQIRPGGSLIGAMVVYLAPGTTAAPTIRDGDTVRAKPQAEVEETTAQFARRDEGAPRDRRQRQVDPVFFELDERDGRRPDAIGTGRGRRDAVARRRS